MPAIDAIAPEKRDAGRLLDRWCRDATGETHHWVSHHLKAARPKVSA
ncbi:hypothetical protein [Sphingomonas sp. PAMC 26605]|nr:hypothetical protein [Sphingomonas sp. PAMC 26605]